jgi:hypothetical protein
MGRFIALLGMFRTSGPVPKRGHLASVLAGLFIVLVFVAVGVRMTWDTELDELVFGFIAMYLMLGILLIRVGGDHAVIKANDANGSNLGDIDRSVVTGDVRSKENAGNDQNKSGGGAK